MYKLVLHVIDLLEIIRLPVGWERLTALEALIGWYAESDSTYLGRARRILRARRLRRRLDQILLLDGRFGVHVALVYKAPVGGAIDHVGMRAIYVIERRAMLKRFVQLQTLAES